MIFSGWYGNGTWSLFRRIMKYKIQTLAAGKEPDDDMCRAVAAMFPAIVDDSNVHLTRIDEPGSFLSQSAHADYTIEGEASTLASEVRAMAMAAYRYRNKQFMARNRRGGAVDGDVDMVDAVAAGEAEAGAKRVETPTEEESDAALIGLESESEGDQDESDAEGGDGGDDEDWP